VELNPKISHKIDVSLTFNPKYLNIPWSTCISPSIYAGNSIHTPFLDVLAVKKWNFHPFASPLPDAELSTIAPWAQTVAKTMCKKDHLVKLCCNPSHDIYPLVN
jgi:hypothetical protein